MKCYPRRRDRQLLECRLKVGLVEAVGIGPPRLSGSVPVDGLQELARTIAELVPAAFAPGRFEQVGVVGHESRSLEDAQRLVVDGAGTRQRVPLRLAFDDADLQAGLAEEDGSQQTDGAAADYNTVDHRPGRRCGARLRLRRHAVRSTR